MPIDYMSGAHTSYKMNIVTQYNTSGRLHGTDVGCSAGSCCGSDTALGQGG